MSHLEIIKEAYDQCGISYVTRDTGSTTFLFYSNGSIENRQYLRDEYIDLLCSTERFIEFDITTGEWLSY